MTGVVPVTDTDLNYCLYLQVYLHIYNTLYDTKVAMSQYKLKSFLTNIQTSSVHFRTRSLGMAISPF